LEPSLGAPGVCSPEGDLSACTSLRSIAVEIVDGDHCDAAEWPSSQAGILAIGADVLAAVGDPSSV